jgi:predicted nuclease with TOPRIM domain
MSLAVIEDTRPDSLFLSTGGGWSPTTDAAIRALVMRDGAELIAATDNNGQGETYAERLRTIAVEACCRFERLRPT